MSYSIKFCKSRYIFFYRILIFFSKFFFVGFLVFFLKGLLVVLTFLRCVEMILRF